MAGGNLSVRPSLPGVLAEADLRFDKEPQARLHLPGVPQGRHRRRQVREFPRPNAVHAGRLHRPDPGAIRRLAQIGQAREDQVLVDSVEPRLGRRQLHAEL